MLKTFIERPVLSTVISIIIVVLGMIGLNMLPIEQYPDIAPPTVRVEATYSGANADVIMNSVIIPLEEVINGVEGMTYMTSSAETGSANITVYFKQGINPDMASVNVQNLINQASSQLPAEVIQTGVTVRKQQTSNILMMSLSSENPVYDATFIENYASINIIPQIKRVYGVGNVSAYGSREYSMRIWLKPDIMASYKISTDELISALSDQNIEAAPGQLGENSNQAFQYTLKYTGRLSSVNEFENVIVRSNEGRIVLLSDVATVELGGLQYNTSTSTDGNPAVMIRINQTPGSNAQEVLTNVKVELEKAISEFPPGLKLTYLVDISDFLNASISKVITTLIEAFLLVFLVVFIFLQDLRSTIIPAIAVPVAIIGTFFFLWLMGFSINLLTLFALLLAIGIVVDDAIVVVEAVHAELENRIKDPKDAAIKAMGEIAPAIISITLVMASVFIPVSFIGGTSGIFYKQFGLTLAIAISISAVNALTLSPALCALFLKPNDETSPKGGFIRRFYYFFNIGFNISTAKYRKTLVFLGEKGHRWITVTIILVCTCILFSLMKIMPTGFVPQEDSGRLMGSITLPPGSSLERTDSVVNAVLEIASEIPEIEHLGGLTGISFMSGNASSYGSVMLSITHWDNRKITVNEVAAILTQKTSFIENATFMFFGTPTIQGFGLSNGVTVNLQDRTGGDIYEFYNVTNDFIEEMNRRKEVMMAMTTFNPNFPQKQLDVNMAKIKDAGITLNDVMGTLQAYIGSQYISNFNLYGKQYRVMVQAAPEYRSKLDDLDGIFVKTASGGMAPVTSFLTVSDIAGPETRTRFNLYSSMELTVIPDYSAGYSTGDVIKAIEEVKEQSLPTGYSYEYSDMTREEANAGSQTILIFGLCLIFVYLLLAALYESYILPLAVIFSLPVGLSGVFIFLSVFGLSQGITNNIYVQISLIMLIGLLAKNAILIVEYAIQRRQQGMSIVDAAINGAEARLRPILMTSFAFIFGLLPLAVSSGAGAIGNRSIGISAIGGMLIGTLIGVLVIPSLYIIFQTIQDRFSKSGIVNSNDEFIAQQNRE